MSTSAGREGRAGTAALGVTVKSGWACAVVLGGSSDAPEVVLSRRVELSDPDDAEARQPPPRTAAGQSIMPLRTQKPGGRTRRAFGFRLELKNQATVSLTSILPLVAWL